MSVLVFLAWIGYIISFPTQCVAVYRQLINGRTFNCIYEDSISPNFDYTKFSFASCNILNDNQQWEIRDKGTYFSDEWFKLQNKKSLCCIENNHEWVEYPDGIGFGCNLCDTLSTESQYWKMTDYVNNTGATWFRLRNKKTDRCMYQAYDGRFGVYQCNQQYTDQLWKWEIISTTSTPTTGTPTTGTPTTGTPTTGTPATSIPTTGTPTTSTPTSAMPTSSMPTSSTPTSAIPTTSTPITSTPTSIPTTSTPITSTPTSNSPTTTVPSTKIPTFSPTTLAPTGLVSSLTTAIPTISSITTIPTTAPSITTISTVITSTTSSVSIPTTTTSNPATSTSTTSISTTAGLHSSTNTVSTYSSQLTADQTAIIYIVLIVLLSAIIALCAYLISCTLKRAKKRELQNNIFNITKTYTKTSVRKHVHSTSVHDDHRCESVNTKSNTRAFTTSRQTDQGYV